MGGLEASVLPLSEVLHENGKARIDSGYFAKVAIAAERKIEGLPNERLGEITSTFRKGIFDIKADTYVEPNEGVQFVRIGDLKGGLIRKATTAWISHAAHKAEKKTALKYGDLILSKTAYPAAAFVNIGECNASQDTVAVRLNTAGKRDFRSGFISAYLNALHGHALMARRFQGNVQQHLSLEDGKAVRVPKFSTTFQDRVHKLVVEADKQGNDVEAAQQRAEATLLAALGLADWTPPEPLSYSARASDAFAAGRLDARFFAPRIQALLDILGRDGRRLGDLATSRRQKFRPQDCATFNYIEIGDIDGAGAATSTPLACADAPSRATWHVRPNDIITSTVRPIRRLSAQIAPEQDGYVASSGFVVIDPQQIAPELLLTFLRLPVICELLDLYASASMYPAVTEAHILGLPFPEIDAAVEAQVVANIREAREAKGQAAQLLEAAKRAVEIAIEDGEDAALVFLDEAEGAD